MLRWRLEQHANIFLNVIILNVMSAPARARHPVHGGVLRCPWRVCFRSETPKTHFTSNNEKRLSIYSVYRLREVLHNFQHIFRGHKNSCAAPCASLQVPRGHSYPTHYLPRVAGRFGFRPFLAVLTGVSPHQKKKSRKIHFRKAESESNVIH